MTVVYYGWVFPFYWRCISTAVCRWPSSSLPDPELVCTICRGWDLCIPARVVCWLVYLNKRGKQLRRSYHPYMTFSTLWEVASLLINKSHRFGWQDAQCNLNTNDKKAANNFISTFFLLFTFSFAFPTAKYKVDTWFDKLLDSFQSIECSEPNQGFCFWH